MCGIYGAMLSSDTAGQKVYQGLKRLEYRGYDSWGVVVTNKADFLVEKQVGKISHHQLTQDFVSPAAIGHTRWATHGGVTQVNAHPHLAKDHSFALVQNGVVENYQLLKDSLEKNGYNFISQTDTEVIVALLEKKMADDEENEPSFKMVCDVFSQLAGRNTIAVLTRSGQIMAVRQGSPLVVGQNDQGDFFISSDVLSLAKDADNFLMLDQGQGVVISQDQLDLFNIEDEEKLEPKFKPIQLDHYELDKNGFEHFMLKEIYEQATVFNNVVAQPSPLLLKLVKQLQQANHVYTLGAGSASFAAGQLAFWLRSAGIKTTELKSYEASSYQDLFTKQDIGVVFSQSGETADTNEVAEELIRHQVQLASIVNMPGSTLSSFSDFPFMLQVGPEVGVASTKALTGQMVWSQLIVSLVTGQQLGDIKSQVARYSQQLEEWLHGPVLTQLQSLAKELINHDHLFVLGKGELFMPALEFALKLKEISYIHAEGFSSGELKHGVIALIEPGTPVFCLVNSDQTQADLLSAAAEVKARGARVTGIAQEGNPLFDEWIKLPQNKKFIALSSFIPAQILTYYLALEKNLDPDKPRNLAKSVTVK